MSGQMTKEQEKALGEKMLILRGKAKDRLAKKRVGLVSPVIKPRYDKVYYEGLAWLNSL